jgi:hypothetical protein
MSSVFSRALEDPENKVYLRREIIHHPQLGNSPHSPESLSFTFKQPEVVMQLKVYTITFLAGLAVAGPCFDAWDCLLVRS